MRPGKTATYLIISLLLLCGASAYLAGISGPFFFDDFTNLIDNAYIRTQSLDLASLSQASLSLSAGPLQRPISMASFAANYYFAGGFESTAAFKGVNLVIHLINGGLVFLLTRRILALANYGPCSDNDRCTVKAAAAIAFLWLVHPIQTTSVLYVVQRMTELAALFSLLGLLCYLNGRVALTSSRPVTGALMIACAFTVCWPLGLFSKETAVLLPVYICVLDVALFPDQYPWSLWRIFSSRQRHVVFVALTLLASGALAAVIMYSLPVYAVRSFSMIERLLTEPRVLLFYLSLIIVPRLDAFGLFHDDLEISTSLFSPWTTAPAIVAIALLIAYAVQQRSRNRLLSLGLLWFFAGHALESTFIALEIAHEHRNYLPSLGILIAGTGVIGQHFPHLNPRLKAIAFLVTALVLYGITATRAGQWSSEREMAFFEFKHHPNSAAATARYANVLLADGQIDESFAQMRRVSQLAPNEAGFLMSLQLVIASRGGPIPDSDNQEIVRRLSAFPLTAVTLRQFSQISDCVTTTCVKIGEPLETWTQAALSSRGAKDKSFLYFVLGRSYVAQKRFDEAIGAYRQAYELDQNYANPLLDLAELYLVLDRPDFATVMLETLRDVNSRIIHKRDREIESIALAISKRQRSGGAHEKPGNTHAH